MEDNEIKKDEQVIEVDYNKDLVDEYKNNYIQDVEGMGAEGENNEEVEPYGTQDTFNEDKIEDLIGEGAELDDEYKNN